MMPNPQADTADTASRRQAVEAAYLRRWEAAEGWRYVGPHRELARAAAEAAARVAGARAVGDPVDALERAAEDARHLLDAFGNWRLQLLAAVCPRPCTATPAELAAATAEADARAWRVADIYRTQGHDAAERALRAERRRALADAGDGEGDAEEGDGDAL